MVYFVEIESMFFFAVQKKIYNVTYLSSLLLSIVDLYMENNSKLMKHVISTDFNDNVDKIEEKIIFQELKL